MSKYEEITAARKLLGLSETATLAEIKSGYHKLLVQWHPDKCTDDPEKCAEMTRKIIAANINIRFPRKRSKSNCRRSSGGMNASAMIRYGAGATTSDNLTQRIIIAD